MCASGTSSSSYLHRRLESGCRVRWLIYRYCDLLAHRTENVGFFSSFIKGMLFMNSDKSVLSVYFRWRVEGGSWFGFHHGVLGHITTQIHI